MKKLQHWLSSLLRVDVVWIEKDDGHWVKRRYYHPVTMAVLLLCVLVLVALLWLNFTYVLNVLSRSGPEAPIETEAPDDISQARSIEDVEMQQHGAPDFSDPDLPYIYPGPMPDGLEVADDEYWIRIIKTNFRLYLYRGQNVERHYYVAVGRNPGDKERFGDNRTPRGIFTVQSIEDSSRWTFDFRDGRGPIRGAYGPWFIRLRTPPWRGIGIHGTHAPDSLGTMVSEGCVRMRNSELEELKEFVRIDMKVVIEE